jgi:hypothetical protein
MVMYRNFLSLVVALVVVSLFAGAAFGVSTTINYNWVSAEVAPLQTEVPLNYVFNTNPRAGDAYVPPLNYNASNDLAFGLTAVLVAGSLHSASGPMSVLTDGVGATNNNQANAAVFSAEHATSSLLFTLPSIQPIGQINTYTWYDTTAGERAQQLYTLYASDGTAPGFVATNPTSPGWTVLANVDDYTYFGSPANFSGQHGVSILPSSGTSMGNYQYFIIAMAASFSDEGWFLNEFAVVKAASVPEPGTLALLAAGLAGLLCYAWRKRKSM